MALRIVGPVSSGAAVGSDGSATASAVSSRIRGRIVAVQVKYYESPPSTTDVTIATQGTDSAAPPAVTLLALTNANTDGLFLIRHQVHGSTGSGLTLDGTRLATDAVPVWDKVVVTIAGANSGDYVQVWFYVEM